MRLTFLPTSLALALTVLAAPAPASAQLGKLIKKAAKAVDKSQDNPNALPPSAFGPELTEQTLVAVLNGLDAQERMLAQRNTVADQRDALATQRQKTLMGHDEEQSAFRQATDHWNQCRDGVLQQIDNKIQAGMAAYQQKLVSDPGKLAQWQQQMMTMQAHVMQMLQKGDTAGAAQYARTTQRKLAGVGGDARADTAQATRTCGNAPPKPAWLAQADADQARVDSLDERVRDLETRANAIGASTAGMSQLQFANGCERIMYWYDGVSGGTVRQRFNDAEVALFNKYKVRIATLERAR
jgi:hypothetical protein